MSRCDRCANDLVWCNEAQEYVDGYLVEGEGGGEEWGEKRHSILCESCLDAASIIPILPLPPHPPEWTFVVYPAHTQSDLFCTATHRFVTDSLDAIEPWIKTTQPPNMRLSFGVSFSGPTECHGDVLLHTLRHGGPNVDTPATMTLSFARYVWQHWPRLPVRVRRARDPMWSPEICASDLYESEEAYVSAIAEYVGGGWWFAGHTRDAVPVGCLVPSVRSWKAFAKPASQVDCWYDSLEELVHAVTCDPKLRDCMTETFYRFTQGGGEGGAIPQSH
jgi:hypothetical protein